MYVELPSQELCGRDVCVQGMLQDPFPPTFKPVTSS